jgi:hypothetical protein
LFNLTEKIHNNPKAPNGSRMLLMIHKNQALDYLNEKLSAADIKKFFIPYDEREMKAHPVIRFQRKEFAEFINSPKVQEFCEYKELAA